MLHNLNFIDIHYHVNPDSYRRRYNSIKAGKIYKDLKGMVVLKNHLGSSVAIAETAYLENLPVLGSLVLNKIAGETWKTIIQQNLCMYNKDCFRLLVHLPTIVHSHHKSTLKRCTTNTYIQKFALAPSSLLDSKFRLKQGVVEILLFAKDYPIIISTGHSNKLETMAVIEYCDKIGVNKLLLNQPANPIVGLIANDLRQFSTYKFIYFEQTALTYLLNYQNYQDFVDVIANIPNVIYSSDLGQTSQMDIQEWLINSHKWFRNAQLSETRIQDITLNNPLKLLSI
ncbi:MAG: DUF6282 family protein [Solitalea-like symbiont of Acarus siro]